MIEFLTFDSREDVEAIAQMKQAEELKLAEVKARTEKIKKPAEIPQAPAPGKVEKKSRKFLENSHSSRCSRTSFGNHFNR